MFFLVAFTVLSLGYIYVARRLAAAFDHKVARYVIYVLTGLSLFAPLAMVGLRRWANTGWSANLTAIVGWFGYAMVGFFTLCFFMLLALDILRWANRCVPEFANNTVLSLSRRRLLGRSASAGIALMAVIGSGYGFYQARRRPILRHVQIVLPNLPPAFDRFRIAQITDIHVGPTIKRPFVQAVVEEVAKLAPDLIAHTGDFVDGSVPWLRQDVAPIKDLVAPFGTFFATGNHEYYSGAEQWLEHLTALGHIPLVNQSYYIEREGQRLRLLGVTDIRAGVSLPGHQYDLAKAIGNQPLQASVPSILLAHQPKGIEFAAHAGIDLQISGHTHGGQFWPNHLLVPLQQPFVRGLHRQGKTQIYVSCGTGYWGPPSRLGIPSEITLIELRRQGESKMVI